MGLDIKNSPHKIFLVLVVSLLLEGMIPMTAYSQNELFNNGALLYINNQAGTINQYTVGDMPTLYVKGEVNNNSGTLQNALGELQITQHFTNSGTVNSTGDEVFIGSTNSNVSGTINGTSTTNNFNNLIVVKSGSTVTLNTDANVKDHLNFTNGIIITGSNTLYVMNTSTSAIVNGATSGTNKYVQGKLKWKTDGSSVYIFPVGHNSQNAQGFTITPTGTSGSDVLGYLETNSTTPVKPVAYCDLETKTAPGQQIGQGSPGADGALDQITFNLASPLQWNVTNPGGGITSYDIMVNANGGQDISPVTSAGGTAIRYLFKNGEPGNTGVTTGTGGSDFPTVGFIACPNQYTLSGMTSFSHFTVNGADLASTSLPVKYLSFIVTPVENTLLRLDWSTAIELNNAGFEVERSTNGIEFAKIGWVVGHDNSTSKQTYQFHDKTVLPNMRYYYRLKQIDNGNIAFEYSKVASGIITGKKIDENDIFVYPNPVTKNLFVVVPEGKVNSISVTNILGEVIYASSDNMQNKTTVVPFENLSSGYYFVTIKGDNLLVTKKILKSFDE